MPDNKDKYNIDFGLGDLFQSENTDRNGIKTTFNTIEEYKKRTNELLNRKYPTIFPDLSYKGYKPKYYSTPSVTTDTPYAQGKAGSNVNRGLLNKFIGTSEDILNAITSPYTAATEGISQIPSFNIGNMRTLSGKEIAQGMNQPFENLNWLMGQGSEAVKQGLEKAGINLPQIGTQTQDERLNNLAKGVGTLLLLGKLGKGAEGKLNKELPKITRTTEQPQFRINDNQTVPIEGLTQEKLPMELANERKITKAGEIPTKQSKPIDTGGKEQTKIRTQKRGSENKGQEVKQEVNLPRKGTFWGIELNDGKMVIARMDKYSSHADLAKSKNINPDNIKSAGFVVDGKYNTQTNEIQRNARVSSIKNKVESIDYNQTAIDRLTKQGKTPKEISKALDIPVNEIKLSGQKFETAPKANQRIISEDSYTKAKENLKKNLGKLGAGIDPTILKDYATIGAYHIENGLRNFANWSEKMIEEFGDKVKPYLTKIWDETHRTFPDLRKMPKAEVPMGEKTSTTKGYNVKTMNPALQEWLPNFVENIRKEFDDQRLRRVTNEQVIKEAQIYANKLNDKDLLNIKPGTVKNSVELTGMRLYAEEKIMNASEALRFINKDMPKEDVASMLKDLEDARRMWTNVRAVGTEAARTVQSMSIPMSDMQIEGMQKLRDFMKDVNPKYAKALDNLLRDINAQPSMKDKAMYWYYNVILSNPFTDAANIIGNASMLGNEFFTRAFSGNLKETRLMFQGLKDGIKNGLTEAKKVYNQEVKLQSKFTDQMNQYRRYDVNAKSTLGKWGKLLLPTTRLALEDSFFREIAKGIERKVEFAKLEEKYGKTIDQLETNVKDILKNENLLDDMSRDYLTAMKNIDRYADYLTFQSELGQTGKALQNLTQRSLFLKFIVPFIRTPANIMKAGVDFSPLGFRRLFDKTLSLTERKYATRRAIAGSIFMAGLGKLMSDGRIEVTGQGSRDQDQQQMLERMGYRTNHVYLNLNGKRYGISYMNLNPINIPLAIIGNYSDMIKYDKKLRDEGKSIPEKASIVLQNTFATISDQSFLQGVSDFFKWTVDGDESYLERFATAPVIPNAVSFPRQLREYLEGNKPRYIARNLEERLKRRIGDYKGLQPALDVFGQQRESGYERFPFVVKSGEDKKLERYLVDHKLNISVPSKTTKLRNNVMTEQQYTDYLKISGEGIKNRLNGIVDRLMKLDDQKAQDLIDDIVRLERRKAKALLIRKGIKQ